MITSYSLYFCDVTIYKDYLKVVIKEGVTVLPEHNSVLLEMVEKHFKDKPFVYLTHRIHSYSVDPAIYFLTSKISNLAAFIVVANDPQQEQQVQVEKKFFNKEFRLFKNMDEALVWKDQFLKNYQD